MNSILKTSLILINKELAYLKNRTQDYPTLCKIHDLEKVRQEILEAI